MKKMKRILTALCAVLVIVILLSVAQLLVVPKYRSNREGALIGEYYDHAGDHDVIFIGDCEVYESIVPTKMWEEQGISAYVRGSAQQLAWQSYYILEDTLRYETPKAVVFNVLALKYGTPQSEAFNRMTLDSMRWSSSKWHAIQASMTEEEHTLDYLFPLLRFHSRITQLQEEDFRYALNAPDVSHAGYLMQTRVEPMTEWEEGRNLSDYTLPKTAMDYLENMRLLCEEKGVELILMKAPTNSWAYWWYEEWEEQILAYAKEKNLTYYNFIPLCEEIGIDWTQDTYDAGVHLNVYGAEKLSSYFASILRQSHGIPDRRSEEDLRTRWDERLVAYYEEKQRMEKGENT